MITKKDTKAVAEIIRTTQFSINGVLASWMTSQDKAGFDLSARMWRKEIADSLANYFATQNPRFDRERFLAACGLEELKNNERLCL